MQRRRQPLASPWILVSLLVAAAFAPRPASAICTKTACDATALTSDAACCSASSCTIDGTLTVSGSNCTFDFGTRNLTVSGTVSAQGKTLTLKAKSMKVTGLVDVRGPGGADGGTLTLVTTGMTALAYSQEGGTSAILDASSTNGAGGHIAIQADGAVSFAKGTVKADGGPAGVGGSVIVSTTGDVSVQISLSASGGIPPAFGQVAGIVDVTTPGNLTVGGSGRLTADTGSVTATIGGSASFADGSVVQANNEGDITMIVGSLSSLGEFRATGAFGDVDLTATAGPMTLSRLSQGITVGTNGSVSLTSDSTLADGTLTMDMPIVAPTSSVDLTSTGDMTISKKIQTTGILLDDGSGEVNLDVGGNLNVTKAIVLSDNSSVEDLTIDVVGNATIAGNLELKGGLDADGGNIALTVGGFIDIQGDIFFNVSGADSSSGGSMDIEAGGSLTVGNSVELIADASPIGTAGSIILAAGIDEVGAPRLSGNLVFAGDIKANGHSTTDGSSVAIQGCDVQIPIGAVIDNTGDSDSNVLVQARTSLTIGGQLKTTVANVLEFPAGGALSLTGSFNPAKSAGDTCAASGGTVTANGCQRPQCTADNVPVGCFYACPSCGDDMQQFPETCELIAGETHCPSSTQFCDAHCRLRSCADANPCTDNACDPELGCTFSLQPNGTSCEDADVCNGQQACQNGNCVTTIGTVPSCGPDGNPCTADGCDEVTGCFHTPLDNQAGVAGCDDANPCTGNELCVAGACQAGTPITCMAPTPFCNPATGMCEAKACQNPGQCDDGNPCTTDACTGGFCANTPLGNGASCDDGNLCNGVRSCSGGVCQPPTAPVVCNDSDVCTFDTCIPATGMCHTQAIAGCCNDAGDCNDADACTTDSCAVDHTCSHTAIVCDDANACTDDSCVPASGCGHTPVVGCQLCASPATCPDPSPGDVCGDKACVAGRCAIVQNPFCCNDSSECADIDSNPCTSNGTCMANHRCEPTVPLTGTACGTTCNPATCQNGTCVPDEPTDCADTDPCTSDVCNDQQGCMHTPIALCCLTATVCNDQNVCTDDACDLDANRCTHVIPDETCTPCSESNPCSGPACTTFCADGRCHEEPANVHCDDDNVCTADGCDLATGGCSHTPLEGDGITGCDDGQACNGVERCVAGSCVKETDFGCDDHDKCTIDNCADATGCVHDPRTGYDAILCRIETLLDMLGGAPADQISAKLKTKLSKRVTKLRDKKILPAQSSTKCAKAKRLLKAAAKQFNSLQSTATRLGGKQIDPTLAADLARVAGEAAGKTETVRTGLGC